MTRPTGIGRYTAYLLKALAECAPDVRARLVPLTWLNGISPRELRRLCYLAWLATGHPLQQWSAGADVVHFTNYQVALWKPGQVRYVTTIHDLAVFLCPDAYPRAYVNYLRRAIRHAAQKADVILADSQAVKSEIVGMLGIPADKVQVCYVGTDLAPMPQARAHLARLLPAVSAAPFLLFVGVFERRKNLAALVQAWGQLRGRFPDLHLVLAGRPGYGFEQIDQAIRQADPSGARIHLLAQGSDQDLRALYTGCSAFVYPSLYEGFGIPLLEAMGCGAPIVASDIPTNSEVGGEAVHLVAPSPEAIAVGVQSVLEADGLRQRLVALGHTRAADFTRRQTASQLLTAYASAH